MEKAIQEDGLVWKTHVSDLKGWKSGLPQLYGFDGIPHTVLVNPDGKIIAQGLRGEALNKKLTLFTKITMKTLLLTLIVLLVLK